mmetsp:Transcript_25816/g.49010  ORF Transcript_25816/g.49010 Transcript_25816/m.49010 type:complete len:307 (-) Transcript_25816:337-1257(-)
MRLQLFKSLWGVVSIDGGTKTLAQALAPLARQGYTGVECSVRLAHDLNRGGAFTALMQQHDLQWVPIVFSSGPVGGWDPFLPGARTTAGHADSVARHVRALAGQTEAALEFGLPIPFFTSHAGHDSFPEEQARALFLELARVEAAADAPLVHEIHRGRCTYSPWALRRLLDSVPELELVADYAHFTCVTETAAGACPELEAALLAVHPRVRHVHARVGFDNGPQVPDPRAPEWLPHTRAFERWWDAVWDAQRARGLPLTSLTPEHGPPSYQPTLPFTRQPVADIEQVNLWLGRRQMRRFQANFNRP